MCALQCSHNLIFNNTILHLETARFLLGPFPGPLCLLMVVARYVNSLAVLASFYVAVTLRFLYFGVWRNIGYLNDELFLKVCYLIGVAYN